MGEQDSKIEMEIDEWFETTCRLMNKVVEQQGSVSTRRPIWKNL
jgi:hypothetical protein